MLGAATASIFAVLVFALGTLRASRHIHEILINSLLRSTFRLVDSIPQHYISYSSFLIKAPRWLDITPVSRIITRCTQDIQSGVCRFCTYLDSQELMPVVVDSVIPSMLSMFFTMSLTLCIKLATIVLVTPTFLIPGIAFFFAGYWLASTSRRSQLPVKRELSKAQAPILASVDNAFSGISK